MKCEKCGSEIEKKTIKIFSRLNSEKIVFEYKGETLEGANLKGADLECADLEGVNLKGADLEYANLKYADLEGANLEDANLEGANLKDANLEDAKTTMCKVNFSSSEYKQAKQFIEGLK